jgi:tetratricopeptide (TPR) repeat protein
MSKFIPFAFIIFLSLPHLVAIDIKSDSSTCLNDIEKKEILSEEQYDSAKSLGDFAVGCLEMVDSEELTPSAKKHLADSIRKNPEARLPIMILTGEWFKNREYQECIDIFLPMAKKHPEAIDLNLSTASAMICLKKNPEAIILLEQCFNTVAFPIENKDQSKSIVNLVYCLGDLYSKLKMFDKGEFFFDKVLKDESMSKNYKIRTYAAIFFSLRADQGEDGFFSGWTKRRFRKKMDENLEACETTWNGLLQSSSANKTKLPAVLELVPILEINKRYRLFENSERIILNTLVSIPENEYALRLLASVYGEWGQYGCSYRIWKKISLKNNSDPFCYYELGHSALMIRNFPEAAKSFEWLLLLSPDFNPVAIYQLGISYFEMGKYDRAILKLDKVTDLPEAKYITAICHGKENRYRQAVSAMEESEKIALSKKRNDFLSNEFYLTYAAFCDKADMFEKTVDILKKQIEKHPDDPETANFLGYVLAVKNKDLDYAKKLIETAIAKEGGNPAYLDSMAWVLFREKDYKSAKTYMEKSLSSGGGSPDAVIADHAGDIYNALGEKDKALKYWKIAAETYSPDLNPESVREKISSIESRN